MLYEREYKEGKISYGKEYHYINIGTTFEGKYKNGKKWEGFANEYDEKRLLERKFKVMNYNFKTLYILLEDNKNEIQFNGNGFIKEYIKDNLMFEGEYKDWKRLQGKEYKGKYIIFEGDYIDGKRYKGREYKQYNFGNNEIDIVFKGEYKNRKKWKGEQIENDKLNKKEYEYNYEEGEKIIIQKMTTGMILASNKKDEETKTGDIKISSNNDLYDLYRIIPKEDKNNDLNEINKTIFKGNNIVQNYNKIGELIFLGEYKNNKKYKGFQREFTRFGELYFNGYFQDNKKYNGIEYNINALSIFEGEFKDNKKFKGKEYNKDGDLVFEGIYNSEGEKWNGIVYNKENQFKLSDGKIEGYVVVYDYINHELFEGEYKNGEKYNGILKIYFDDINYLLKKEIEIKNGKLTGKGKEYYGNKRLKYEGNYLDGKFSGLGILYYEYSGHINYNGEFKEGMKHGEGKEFDKIGNLIYQGKFVNGEREPLKIN